MKQLLERGAVVALMTSLSRLSGLARDVLFAAQFGASAITDAFLIAFKIPNFFRRLTAEGAFNHVFIPVLARIRATGTRANLRQFIASGYGVFGLAQLTLAALIGLAAPVVIAIFAPGILDNPGQYQLAVQLLYWTAPYLFLISLTSMFAALLNFHDRFALPAAVPILLNLSLIAAIVYGAQWHESHITAVAAAVSVAGVLQLLILLPAIAGLGYALAPTLVRIHAGVKDMLRLMIPVILGTAIVQVSLLIDTLVASLLETGSITWLYYSDRLIELPLGVFAIALATVITPTLSRMAAQERDGSGETGGLHGRYRQTLWWALRLCMILALPSAIGLALTAPLVVNTLFEYGQFTAFDTHMTRLSIYAYALGLPAFMLIKPLVASFYAHEDTRTPLRIAALAIVVTLCGHFAVLMLHLFSALSALHVGLALSTSAGAWCNTALLVRAVRRRGWLAPAAAQGVQTTPASGHPVLGADQGFVSVEGGRLAGEECVPEWVEGRQQPGSGGQTRAGQEYGDHEGAERGASGAVQAQTGWIRDVARLVVALVAMVAVLTILIAAASPWHELAFWQKIIALAGIVGAGAGTYLFALWASGMRVSVGDRRATP